MAKGKKRLVGIRSFFRNRLAAAGVALVVLVVATAILAPWFAPQDPSDIHPRDRYAKPSRTYLLGTDYLGRDIFSRILYGTRLSLAIGGASIGIALVLGFAVGTFAAFKGGVLDAIVVEIANMFISIPTILLGIMILALWGQGFFKLTVTLAGAFFPRFIRIARGLTLAVKEEQFIEAARAIGRRDLGILARHVWPNLLGEAVVAGTLWVSAAILSEAGLSFLGLGIAPPTPTWGNMIRDGIAVILTAPWVALFPGIAIAATVVGFNMIGDAVRDYLDPRIHR